MPQSAAINLSDELLGRTMYLANGERAEVTRVVGWWYLEGEQHPIVNCYASYGQVRHVRLHAGRMREYGGKKRAA